MDEKENCSWAKIEKGKVMIEENKLLEKTFEKEVS